jgi:hypothetical protein
VIVCTMFVAGLIVAVTTGQRNPGAAGKNPDRAPGEPALQAEATHERSYP